MGIKSLLVHGGICAAIATPIAYFTDVKWLAAACFVSAALFLNGTVALYEDALPGGFDNPDGTETPAFAQGAGAIRFWLSSLAITATLAFIGLAAQLLF
jgi:hypothetical protein